MSFDLTTELLDGLQQSNPEDFEIAVEETFANLEYVLTVEVLRVMIQAAPGVFTISDLLLTRLEGEDFIGRFLSVLGRRGIDLFPGTDADTGPFDTVFTQDFEDQEIGDVALDTLDFDGLQGFVGAAKSFRCRVNIQGLASGSGALVSPRLVLTSAHVVGAMAADETAVPDYDVLPRPTVIAQDGKSYPARVVWVAMCLTSETTGQLPARDIAPRFCDAALLRIDPPLGRDYGHVALPPQPPKRTGAELLWLVHYPNGRDNGLSIGKVLRDDHDDLRHIHNINTDPGSSGGPGFDREFNFVGLHQGRWLSVRRLVPYAQIIGNDGFRAALTGDRPPERLWSLSDRLDGHFVVGRDRFFDALNAIVAGERETLRGVWIKRLEHARTEGLSFSYDILKKYLRVLGVPHQLERVQLEARISDLIGSMHRQVFGAAPPPNARPGVQADETTNVAHHDDRAKALADKMNEHAQKLGVTLWLYLDDPRSDATEEIQEQLEHLVNQIMSRPHLRLVLSGFETYYLRAAVAQEVAAVPSDRATLLVEYLGDFRTRDVTNTVRAMVRALGLSWDDASIDHEVRMALSGLQQRAQGVYSVTNLKTVAQVLKDRARRDGADQGDGA